MENEEQFSEAITMIADKLDIAASHIYQVYVEAQAIRGIILIVSCIAVVLFIVAGYFITMRVLFGRWSYRSVQTMREKSDKYYDSDDEAGLLIVPVMIAITFGLISCIFINVIGDGIMMILCPEYTAISEIINLVVP